MFRGIVALLCVLTAASPASAPGRDVEAPRPAAPAHAGACVDGLANDRPSVAPLPFHYDLYTFRGDAGNTLVVAAFAVPAGELERERCRGGAVRYRFDVSLVLADTAQRLVTRTDDSVFVGSARPLPREHLLYTHIALQAEPSTSTVQRVIMTDAATPGVGQLYDSAFRIPDYTGGDLMLSDIALGQPEAESGWERGDVTLALLPTSQLPQSSFDVYYEIYNLPPGNRYITEIAVEPESRAGGDRDDEERAVRLRFTGESAARPDGSLQELRRVDASLARGRYRLTVTITDEDSGRIATRSRLFQVRGWGPGATMVAALPRTSRWHDR